MMEHFYIIVNSHKDSHLEKTTYIKKYLETKNKKCTVQVRDADLEQPFMNSSKIPEDVDCVLVLGGDGTLLQAARDLIDRDIPLLGVNLGTLGYLAEVEEIGLESALNRLIAGEYEVEKRMMITGKLIRGAYHEELHHQNNIRSYDLRESYALNDISITRCGSLQIIKFNLYVNGQFLSSYCADGVIVATPTGSTGYNLSAGGPIVEPKAELLVVTPICPHALNKRSMILAPADIVEIEVAPGREDSVQQVEVNFDGSHKISLYTGDRVRIEKAAKTTEIIKLSNVSFLEVLHKKMSD